MEKIYYLVGVNFLEIVRGEFQLSSRNLSHLLRWLGRLRVAEFLLSILIVLLSSHSISFAQPPNELHGVALHSALILDVSPHVIHKSHDSPDTTLGALTIDASKNDQIDLFAIIADSFVARFAFGTIVAEQLITVAVIIEQPIAFVKLATVLIVKVQLIIAVIVQVAIAVVIIAS